MVCLALTNAQRGRQDGGRGSGGFRDKLKGGLQGMGEKLLGGLKGGVGDIS